MRICACSMKRKHSVCVIGDMNALRVKINQVEQSISVSTSRKRAKEMKRELSMNVDDTESTMTPFVTGVTIEQKQNNIMRCLGGTSRMQSKTTKTISNIDRFRIRINQTSNQLSIGSF